MRRLLLTFLAAATGLGCQSPEPPEPPKKSAASTGKAAPRNERTLPQPPPERLALPLRVLDMRLRDETPAGTLVEPGFEQPVALQSVGLNICQTGYVLQAFYRGDDGALRATPPFPLPVLRTGRVEHAVSLVEGQRLETNFEHASMQRLKGTFRVLEKETDKELLKLSIDTQPVGIASGPGLGAQGCFTTGTWTLTDDGQSLQGPASAVWDNALLTWVGIRLDSEHTIDFWVTIPPQHRQPGRMLRGDLERVGQEPRKFPFRVVFRARDETGKQTEMHGDSGTLTAAFVRANPQGPLRIQLSNLKVPEWTGPFAGETIEEIRAEALIVTDLKGSQVPIPAPGDAQK